ncbi:hypothetical protein LF1_39930 [Rubripirellula obstinata]|uniref:Aerotolerance regulator N-terminal domain-containing protein n=1 Tax=Rubripirellula obstinata TaxID=406547 RepID=A0A5B1CPY9_9BACT|nr:BatA domain-containing protein [Rubripirellula obstinata]KAA1261443.1 hypothetical protein LF1_39930 [Rubripirellula obstinata]
MSFLNATLILGTLAAVVPVVLHLIARREPKKVTFPSIAFLTKRFESNRSRLRVRRWWLLAMRILAIAALALALARPAIHQSLSVTWLSIGLIAAAGIALLIMATIAIVQDKSRAIRYGLAGSAAVLMLGSMLWGVVTFASGPSVAIDDSGPIAIAIVVDNSLTSGWKTANDNRTERMIDVASGVIAKLPRTSRIAVLDRSATPASFSLDVAGALSKLESTEPTSLPRSIVSRLQSATQLVQGSELENRHVLVLTDLANSTWDDPNLETLLSKQLSETANESKPVSLTVFDTGEFRGVNRSLTSMRLADPTPPANSPMSISVTLDSKSFGDDSDTVADSVTVEAQLYQTESGLPVVRDGDVVYPPLTSVDRTTAEITAGAASELLFTIPGLPVGTHHGRLRIVGEDAMAADDERYFSIAVLPPSSVLIVSGDEEDAGKEAKVIEDAITASVSAGTEAGIEFMTERIGYGDLPVARLSDYDAVAMLDPPSESLSDPAIANYLASGGGVLVALGPSANQNAETRNADDSAWLPLLIRRWRVPEPGTFFQITDAMHPATESLGGDTPWNDFAVTQYWQVEPTVRDTVLFRFAGTEHPAMLARESVNPESAAVGRTLILTTPLPALANKTRSWNRLFGIDPWPAWLLTRQSIDYLTGRQSREMMTMVGTPWTQSLERDAERSSENKLSKSSGIRLQIFAPDGSPPIPVEAETVEAETVEAKNADPRSGESSQSITVADTRSPGVYWIKGGPSGTGFSANLSDDAIELDRIDRSKLDQWLGSDGWVYATEPDQITLTSQQSSQRISLTSPAMLLALLVFLLEQVLGNRFYRSK